MSIIFAILAGLIGYAIGSIPVGLLVSHLKGVDPRQVGSGRTGGTNVYRATGSLSLAILTAAGDVLKGTIPVLLARILFPSTPLAQALAGIAAVAGHNWSVYIHFAGGAGAMTHLGALLAFSPLACLISVPAAFVALRLSRMASVGTLTLSWVALIVLLILAFTGVDLNPFSLRPTPLDQVVYGIGQAALVTYALRPNIGRLLRGEERRVEY